jgi:hypothetical protein
VRVAGVAAVSGATGLDYCPTCRRHIFDYDPAGREDTSGQRHCAGHAPSTCEGHGADAPGHDCDDWREGVCSRCPVESPAQHAGRIEVMAAAAHAAAWGRLYAPLVARAGSRGQVVTMPAWETEPDDSRDLWRHVVASALVAGGLV